MYHTNHKSTIKNSPIRDNWRQFAAPIIILLCLISPLALTACGELEFGVETKVSSGHPEVPVVTTSVAQLPEGMVLVTVTPSAQATRLDKMTATPVATEPSVAPAIATHLPTSAATVTAVQPIRTRPPAWPTHTPTPTVDWPEILIYPTVSDIVWPGESVTIEYKARGNSAALCLATPFTQNWTCYSVPTSGSYELDIDADIQTSLQLELRVFGANNDAVAPVNLMLYCDVAAWFFSGPPTTCPAGAPVQTAAAYQRFEHGTMLWLEDGQWLQPGNMIYVLYDDPHHFVDPFPESALPNSDSPMPNIDYDPPEGLFVPESGFGLLWRENSFVRQQLGWALAPEMGYAATVQRELTQNSVLIYLLDAEGRLIVLDFYTSTWAERSQP